MIDLDLLIVGAGGNGQSYFMLWLKNQGIKVNDICDKDGYKHLSCPTLLEKKKCNVKKCIFIYNDPLNSIKSHYRRGWQYQQIIKLGNPFNLKKENINTFEKYINLVTNYKKDLFGIEYQFNNWTTKKVNFPIYFLDFNNISNKINELSRFIGKKLDRNTFIIKERNSEYIAEDKYSQINNIYDNLYLKIKNVKYSEVNNVCNNLYLKIKNINK